MRESAARGSAASGVASPKSPGTVSTATPASAPGRRAALRTSARTRWPRDTSTRATCRPTNPVAPVMAINTAWGSGRGAAALVQEDQGMAPPDDSGQRFEHLRVEHRPRQAGDPLGRLLGGHLVLIRPRRGEGVVDLGCPDNPRAQRDLLAL